MPTQQKTTPAIRFAAKLSTIGSWTILRLPAGASAKLSSRGQIMVEGALNGVHFQTPLEPDGNWSHWFKPAARLLEVAGAVAGDTVTVEIRPVKDWPEPDVPADLQHALLQNTKVHNLWQDVTPMARWEWIRWIRSTGNTETRQRRIKVACSKLQSGKRRPCCWNRNLCTEPSISKNGVLLEPTPAR